MQQQMREQGKNTPTHNDIVLLRSASGFLWISPGLHHSRTPNTNLTSASGSRYQTLKVTKLAVWDITDHPETTDFNNKLIYACVLGQGLESK